MSWWMNLQRDDVRASHSSSWIVSSVCGGSEWGLTMSSRCLKRRASWIPDAISGGKVYRILSPPSEKCLLAVCSSYTISAHAVPTGLNTHLELNSKIIRLEEMNHPRDPSLLLCHFSIINSLFTSRSTSRRRIFLISNEYRTKTEDSGNIF
jgi:hypothetical protein